MKISVIQPEVAWENKSLNYQILSGILSPLYNKTDIVILPEMFNTGFSMNTLVLSEPMRGETFSWMKNMAENGNFGICGSYMIREGGSFYNRWVFVSPGNEIMYYDKRHLFSMGGEKDHFTPGKSRLVFAFRGMTISPYICYDLRFPVWSRNTEKSDLMIYASNWPDARQNVWNTLLKARAIENQCYVAGSNIVGKDGMEIFYSGESVIINPRGEIIASAKTDTNVSVTAEISLKDLNDFRKKFPVLDDADEFTFKRRARR